MREAVGGVWLDSLGRRGDVSIWSDFWKKYTGCLFLTYRRVYYLRIRDFAQTLGHVFGSKNMKEATIVDLKGFKKLELWMFRVLFKKKC